MILAEQGEKKVYSDTAELEKEMLDIAREYPEDLSQDYIASDNRYTVNNTFSSVRHNLFNWYNFKENATVLEVGAGMGSVTGLLCDKFDYVVALEMSEARAAVIKNRYPERHNLKIVCDDVFEWKTDDKFDYVIVTGVLEYAQLFCDVEEPFYHFVDNLKRFLKEDGIVLLAIENRFGLKYWCGASEDHICRPFVGINGYKEKNTAVTFSKKELDLLFEKAGFCKRKFYYVLPDYKFPTMIYTDDHTPNASAIQKLALSYVRGSVLVCNEKELYKDIIENNVQDFFANSFLIEASFVENQIEQPVYVAAKGECKKQYRVSTLIYSSGKVEKVAMHIDAKEHINNIVKNERDLEDRNVRVLHSDLYEDRIEMDYFDGTSAEQMFHMYLKSNDFNSLMCLIKSLREEILKSSDFTEKSIFDDMALKECYVEKDVILKNGYIDMTFSNCFVENQILTFFDQEWKFDNIPLNFILFYAVRQSYLSYVGKTQIDIQDIYQEMGISNCIDAYIELERFLWDKILYRQEHFYDGDGWYNHYFDDMELCSVENKSFEYESEINEKNEYILSLENQLAQKIDYDKKLELDIEQKNAYLLSLENEMSKKNDYQQLLEEKIALSDRLIQKYEKFSVIGLLTKMKRKMVK